MKQSYVSTNAMIGFYLTKNFFKDRCRGVASINIVATGFNPLKKNKTS